MSFTGLWSLVFFCCASASLHEKGHTSKLQEYRQTVVFAVVEDENTNKMPPPNIHAKLKPQVILPLFIFFQLKIIFLLMNVYFSCLCLLETVTTMRVCIKKKIYNQLSQVLKLIFIGDKEIIRKIKFQRNGSRSSIGSVMVLCIL